MLADVICFLIPVGLFALLLAGIAWFAESRLGRWVEARIERGWRER